MRILSIDFGDKNIGLAVSDKLRLTAQSLGVYQRKNKKKDLEYFNQLVSEYEVSEIVIGLPLRMDGSLGPRAEKTKEFGLWLEKAVNCQVIYWDERLTTKQAVEILKGQKKKQVQSKTLKDQISATIILSAYLESQRV